MTEPRFQDEERRAREYQARQRRIAANQRAYLAGQRGNAAEMQQIEADWRPIILAQRERQADINAPDEPDCEGFL